MTTPTNLPNAIFERSFTICGIEIKTYVLDDGRRILDMDGTNKLLDWIMRNPDEITEEDAKTLLEIKNGRTVMEKSK